MSVLVGYQLIDISTGNAVSSWGGVYGQTVPPPQMITLPNGDDIYNPVMNEDYNGYKLTQWFMDPTPEQAQSYNKSQASSLLTATDWTAIPSVADPAQSNPYLTNQSDFLSYRSQVRAIAVNPPTTPINEWPIVPKEIWSN